MKNLVSLGDLRIRGHRFASFWVHESKNLENVEKMPHFKIKKMATTNTYLNFDGTCEEAFNFYKSVFGGEFHYIGRFGEMPESDDYSVPEGDKNKIMHVSLPIGTSILMGSDIGGDWAPTFVQGNNFSVSITPESKQEADTLFNALSKGGQVTTPIHHSFWGAYFGMFTDKFGINWMVNFDEKK